MTQEITYFKLENFLCANWQGNEMIANSASTISISDAKCSKYRSGFARVVKKMIERRIITDHTLGSQPYSFPEIAFLDLLVESSRTFASRNKLMAHKINNNM